MALISPYLATHAAPGYERKTFTPYADTGNEAQTRAQGYINQGLVRPNYNVDWNAAQRASTQAARGYLSPTPDLSYLNVPKPTSAAAAGLAAPGQKPIPYTDAQIRDMYTKTLLGDPTLAGQLGETGSLRAQLASQWQGGVLTPALQALTQYGGDLPQDIVNQLKGIAGPSLQTPYGTFSLGASLGDVAADPSIAANTGNPYTTLNQIKSQYETLGGQRLSGVYGRGLGHSSAVQNALNDVHQHEGLARYNAAQQLLQGITGNVTGFDSQLTQASQTQGQYLANAQQNLTNLMNAGLITIPSYYTPTSPFTNPEYVTGSAVPGRYYRSGYGTYGMKPQF